MNRVTIGTLVLNNPFIGASGTFGNGSEFEDFFDLKEIGGFVSKGITLEPQLGNAGRRIVETPSGILNSIGLQNIGIRRFIAEILPMFQKMQCPAIVNISGKSVQQFWEMAQMLHQPEVAALELNLSCPNLRKDGVVFGSDAETVYQVVSGVKQETEKPILVKLSPNVTDIKPIASAAEAAGADAICLINTMLGMVIDIKSAKPVLGNQMGGLSGPAIRPVGVRMVWQAAETVSIPVIGIGGIETLEDALQYILAGASAVQIGTANLYAPSVTADLAKELEDYCKSEGLADYSALIGKANLGFKGERR